MGTQVIAVDLGGTNIRGAVVTREGVIVRRGAMPTLASDGPDAVMRRIVEVIESVAGDAQPALR